MEIRKLTIEDYEEVYRLWVSTPGMGLNDRDDSRTGIEQYLRRNPETCFVAVSERSIVGSILCGHDGRRGFLYHTAVASAFQRQGVGSALLDAALNALQAEGIHKAALVVFAHNVKGNAFWEKEGFFAREDLKYRDKALEDTVLINN